MSLWGRRTIAAGLLIGLIVIGVYALQWQGVIDDVLRSPRGDEGVRVRLYFADDEAQCLLVEERFVFPANSAGKNSIRVMEAALEALATGPERSDLWPTIPEGARVVDVTLQDGIVAVDYSEELQTNHGGGSAGEILTVSSIVGTLSEFPGVEAVQILIAGQRAETLSGHLTLLEPIRIRQDALAAGRICWDGIQ